MDDLMSPDFYDLSHIRCHTGAYFVSVESYRSSWSYMITPIYRMRTETRTCSLFYHDPSVEPLLSHPGIMFDICMSSCFLFWETLPWCWVWFGLRGSHISCHSISDLPYIWCHTRSYSVSDDICESSWSCTIISTYEIHAETRTYSLFYCDPPVEPFLSRSSWPAPFGT